MKNLKFNKEELLKTIKANRDTHRAIFEAAYEGFHKALIAQLDKMKEAALAKKKVAMYVGLTEPVDQTEAYDRAIKMLELSSDSEIVLDEREFAQYVLDEWGWKHSFINSNAVYALDSIEASELQKYAND